MAFQVAKGDLLFSKRPPFVEHVAQNGSNIRKLLVYNNLLDITQTHPDKRENNRHQKRKDKLCVS